MRRRVLPLLLVLLAGCGGRAPPAVHGAAVLRRAADWLWARQADDGGWHSTTYGLLRSGQSLTPFVLDALLDVAANGPERRERVQRAVRFLVARVDADGAAGRSDAELEDYPTYATALALVCLRRLGGHAALVERMERWLLRQQLGAQHGWRVEHPAYGAWGMGGELRRPPEPGHVDVSMTRYVLQALAGAQPSPALERARAAAGTFLGRLEHRPAGDDGTWGYFFTTIGGDKNKAGTGADGRHLAYGTATADGVLCDLATGTRRVNASGLRGPVGWLVRRHRLERVPALTAGPAEGWGESMLHYYRAASAQVFAACGITEAPRGRDWRRDLVVALAREQRSDGSFANAGTLMKEDDPLIATALAVKALATALAPR